MDVIIENLPQYWDGFLRTLFLSVVSGIIALVFGTLLAAARVSPVAALRGFSMAYVEIVRNTPLTIAFFFAAVVLPRLGVTFQQFEVAAIIALSAYTSAFIAEAVRSGVNSVPVGQAEAARSIGMKFSQVLSLIILPQALRTVIPPLINILIALVKNSSVAGAFYVLGTVRLRQAAGQRQRRRRHVGSGRRRILLPADNRPAGLSSPASLNERWRSHDELCSLRRPRPQSPPGLADRLHHRRDRDRRPARPGRHDPGPAGNLRRPNAGRSSSFPMSGR